MINVDNSQMRASIPTFIVGLTIGTALVVQAAEKGPHDDAIKGRQAMFQTFSFNMGILGAMAKERIPYDARLANESATNLLAAANFSQSAMWPAGSDNATPGNRETRALPAIWESTSTVVEKSDDLKAAVKVLADQADNGLDALQRTINDVGAACKACHDDYRAEKN